MRMNRYLITAALAVAIGGAFTSCRDDSFSGTTIDKKAEAFEEAFIRAFGEPDPNHTWGFGDDEMVTRGHNADANMWVSYGWTVPRELSREQKNRVIAYFQNNQLTDGGEKPWTDFFVQQVYKGGEENGSYVNILKTSPALTTEKYKASGMTEPAYGSNQLDKLFADTDDHINNYNGGQCSTNENVSNSEGITYLNPRGNNQHADQIMLMVDSHAKDFGYNCSQISIEYNDHYTLVDGSVIDEWAAEHGNNIGESVSGRAFVGFDFDLLTPDEWYTDDDFKITDLSSAITLCTYANGDVKTLEEAGLSDNYIYNEQPVKYLHKNATNMISGAIKYSVDNNCGIADLQNPWGKTFSKAKIDELLEQGYRPVKGAPSTWVKPEITRDHYYSDWIVSIIPGEKTNNNTPTAPQVWEEFSSTTTTGSTKYQIIQGVEVVESGRVMCEDLGSSELTDIDFNDIVFDAIIVREYQKLITTTYDGADGTGNILSVEESYTFTNVNNKSGYDNKYALIRLMAAGGTIQASVAGYDVHNAFNGTPTTTMINTTYDNKDVNGASIVNTKKAVDLENKQNGRRFYDISSIKDIEIDVKYAKDSKKLTAKKGAAPYKFKVPLGTPWAKERKMINLAYPSFSAYVKNQWTEFWNNPAAGDDYDTYIYTNNNLEGLSVSKDVDEKVETVYDKTINTTVPTNGKRLVNATHNQMDVPASSEIKLLDYDPSAPGFLYSDGGRVRINDFSGNKALQAGDVIRVYGVSIAGWEVNCTLAKKTEYASNTSGYFDISVGDASTASQINSNGLVFSGKHFTITYVTICRTSSTPDNNNNTDNPSGGSTGNLLTSNAILSNWNIVAVVTDQSDAQNVASTIVAGTSKIVVDVEVTNSNEWGFKMGPAGNSGDGIISEINKNTQGYADATSFTIEKIIDASILASINNNVNNTGWWSGGLFGLQGTGVTVTRVSIE